MRSDRGQGTIEYIAVVLLVALVFTGTATAATGAGPDIAAAVPREIVRALCIVRGGDCYRDRAPCDVTSNIDATSIALEGVVFTIGDDKTVTVTRRSDGKVSVSLDTAPVGEAKGTLGARGKVSLGKRTIAGGAELSVGVTGSWDHGRTWVLPSEDAARRLVDAIRDDRELPPADLEGHEGTLEGAVRGQVGTGVAASGGATATLSGGWQTERATGNRTYHFALAGSGEAALSAGVASASASAGRGAAYALTVGRDGRWLELTITRSGTFTGRADLPREIAPVAAVLDVPTGVGRRWVSETHLDLTDARNLAAARAVVAGARDPLHRRALEDALARLSTRIEDNAIVDARTYATDETTYGIEGRAAFGLKIGGKYERTRATARLVAARTRDIGRRWSERNDCLKVAHG
jgi:hypothetical protein